jgi:hypothetical protein
MLPGSSDDNQWGNIFEVHEVRPISYDACAVTGVVKAGTFHVGDILELSYSLDDIHSAPTLSMSMGEKSVEEVHEGESVTITLLIDVNHVFVGDLLKSHGRRHGRGIRLIPQSTPIQPPPSMERPAELKTISRKIKQGAFASAEESLRIYMEKYPGSIRGRRLLAELFLAHDSPFFDPQQGLQEVQAVYESLKMEDPTVTFLLANALAETDYAEMGLHLLERSYASLTDANALEQWAQRIHDFRNRYKMGTIWEIVEESGKPLLETGSLSEIVTALENGNVSAVCLCRRNRVGRWQPVSAILNDLSPRAQKMLFPEKLYSAKWLVIILALITFSLLALVLTYQFMLLWRSL